LPFTVIETATNSAPPSLDQPSWTAGPAFVLTAHAALSHACFELE
jgi:hypothetical protein